MSESKDLYHIWRNRLDIGLAFQKKWKQDFRVEDLDAYWEGFQKPASWTGEFIPINLMYANVKSQLDGILVQSPAFSIRPSRTNLSAPSNFQMLDLQAQLRENTLNYFMSECNTKAEIKKCLLDAYPHFGVAKVCYKPFHKPHPKAGEKIENMGYPMMDKEGNEEVYPEKELIDEKFYASRRNPSEILLDPYADSLENIKWVAERISYTKEEFENEPLFTNTSGVDAHNVLSPSEQSPEDLRKRPDGFVTRINTGGNSSFSGSKDTKFEEVIYVWEIYDINNRKIICVVDNTDRVVRNDDYPDWLEDHPYEFLYFNLRRNSAYPIPELYPQLGPQDEYNITRNQIITHRKRFNRKYEVREGTISDEELSKFEDPYDGLVIKTNTDGHAIKPIVEPSLDQAVYFDVNMLRKDFMDISGDSIPDSDIAKIEKTGVASLLNQRMQNRRTGKLGVVQEFIQRLGKKLMLLIEHELTLPVAIAINGPMGQAWQGINPDDFTRGLGEFNYEVAVGSLIPRDPDTERSSWIAFLQFIAMNPNIGQSPILLAKTAKMFGVEDKSLIQEMVNFAMAIQQQQMMQGGQPGQPSMSGDMAKTLGMGGQ